MMSRGSLELFKKLNSQTTNLWKAIHASLGAGRLQSFAEALDCTRKELLDADVPLDRVEPALHDLSGFPKLAQRRISKAWAPVVATRNAIFDLNAGLIAGVVSRYGSQGSLTKEDLWQEGAVGLIKAIYRFRWRMGYQFSTYATHWIRHAIGRAASNGRSTIRIPIHAQVPGATGLPYTVPLEVRLSGRNGGSSDNEGAGSVYDSATDEAPNAEKRLLDHEAFSALHGYLDRLEPMQRDIIARRYFHDEPESLAVIGKRYNLSRERIRQIEQAALEELRGMVKA